MKSKILSLFLVSVVVTGCGNKKAEHFNALPFPDISRPAMIESQQEAAEYLAEHYWDAFTDTERTYPSDSLLSSGVRKRDIEQKYSNWISILDMVDLKVSEKSLNRLYERALACEKKDTSSNVFEEYYLHYASRLASYEGYSREKRDGYAFHAGNCSLNRLGQPAADFRFADSKGKIRRLYDVKAPYTLLFFSNPGCEACMNIIETLKAEPKVSEMISAGHLAVLNIYIDEDLQGWRDYMPVYPDNWYNCFDPDMVIRGDNLYSVRAIPSLYLLDKEKRVILKDAPENKMMYYLVNL